MLEKNDCLNVKYENLIDKMSYDIFSDDKM